jgi:hypothetical protein
MPRVVRTFVAASPSLKAEILDSLAKARPQSVRQIEITMTDDYKRRQRAWQVDDLPLDDALREICEFIEGSIADGMRECMVAFN